jgi:hypothetical protein
MQRQGQATAISPANRTVGQLVADAIRFYSRRFWPSLALGIAPAALTVGAAALPRDGRVALLATGWPVLMALTYVAACFLVSGTRFGARRAVVAFAIGIIIALPVPVLIAFLVLPGVLWLGLVGMAVPACVVEGSGLRASFRRGVDLGRADYAHAAGTIATLVLVVVITQLMLFQLLHGLSDQATAVAAFLANMVIAPLLFLGSALLYEDQAARARVQSKAHRAKEA